MNIFLSISQGLYADFYGWEVVTYYFYAVRQFMQEYSWQVRLAYGIILACIVVMFVLMFLFWMLIRRRNRHNKNTEHCYNTYAEPFRKIMQETDILTEQQIFEICDADQDDFDRYSGQLFAEVICSVRMSLPELIYIPNLQRLCEMTGTLKAMESNLKSNHDVLRTLQIVNILPLIIHEGLLSIYTGHKNDQVAMLARVGHMLCSKSEPFLYFLEDMNVPHNPWYRITVHRILGWKQMVHMPMPPLSMLASTCKDVHMASFLITEISYWGSEQEKKELINFCSDERIECRIAALTAIARLEMKETESTLLSIYDEQPQDVRRVMQRTLWSFHSGSCTQFFVDIYLNTPSQLSCRVALECLYDYNEQSHAIFEKLALEATDGKRVLFDQIRTTRQIAAAHHTYDAQQGTEFIMHQH